METDDDLTAFFTADHRSIDAAWAAFRATGGPAAALAALAVFEGLLARHMDWEERLLFPAFEGAVGGEAAPTVVSMRVQHDEMRGQIAYLKTTLKEGGAARRNAEQCLVETLADHNHAEEDYIYPWMDGVLPGSARRALLEATGARAGGARTAA